MSRADVDEALATMAMIATLKLPKGTTLVGSRDGVEVHRRDGVSYIVRLIPARYPVQP